MDSFSNTGSGSVAGGMGGLGTPLNPTDTTLYLATGEGATFSASTPFRVVFGSLTGAYEIAECTNITGDVLTITRGPSLAMPDTCTAAQWVVGTPVAQVLTAGALADIVTRIKVTDFYIDDYAQVGSSDDTSWVAAAYAALVANGGGTLRYGPRQYNVSSPLAVTQSYTRIIGAGRGATTIQATSGFSGAALMTFTQAHYCSVEHLRFKTSAASSATAPAADAIQVIASRNFIGQVLDFQVINGYCVSLLASATLSPYAPYGAQLSKLHCLSAAGGIYMKSNATAGQYPMQAWMSDLNLEGVDGPLDSLHIEDCEDVEIQNVNGAVNNGIWLHVVGNCATIFGTNLDLGWYASSGSPTYPIVQIDSNANGSPTGVNLTNGVFQKGAQGLVINAGTDLKFTACYFTSNAGDGVDVLGSSAIYAAFNGCMFNNNNTAGSATTFDLLINNSSARLDYTSSWFRTPVGSGVKKVTASVYAQSASRAEFVANYFDAATVGNIGTAFYGAAVTSSAKLPHRLVDNYGVNPVGPITVSPSGTSYTAPTLPFPVTYYITGTVTPTVGSTSLGSMTNPTVRVPAATAFSMTYTTAPTVVAIGE